MNIKIVVIRIISLGFFMNILLYVYVCLYYYYGYICVNIVGYVGYKLFFEWK